MLCWIFKARQNLDCEDGVLGEEEEQSISAHSGDAGFSEVPAWTL